MLSMRTGCIVFKTLKLILTTKREFNSNIFIAICILKLENHSNSIEIHLVLCHQFIPWIHGFGLGSQKIKLFQFACSCIWLYLFFLWNCLLHLIIRTDTCANPKPIPDTTYRVTIWTSLKRFSVLGFFHIASFSKGINNNPPFSIFMHLYSHD